MKHLSAWFFVRGMRRFRAYSAHGHDGGNPGFGFGQRVGSHQIKEISVFGEPQTAEEEQRAFFLPFMRQQGHVGGKGAVHKIFQAIRMRGGIGMAFCLFQKRAGIPKVGHEHAVGRVLHQTRRDDGVNEGAPFFAEIRGQRAAPEDFRQA